MIVKIDGTEAYVEEAYTKDDLLKMKQEAEADKAKAAADLDALTPQIDEASKKLEEADSNLAWVNAALAEFPEESEPEPKPVADVAPPAIAPISNY